jgi:DNA-binding response OmpR family regulator
MVRATDNGIDALILAQGDPPDLIVVDQVVGWLDVRYLLTLLRRDARTTTTPILLITPRADGAFARYCHEFGTKLLVKPGERSLAASAAPTTASVRLRERARQR